MSELDGAVERLAALPSKHTTEQPMAMTRWLRRNGERVLQQYWAITHYTGINADGLTGEWRDVPIEG